MPVADTVGVNLSQMAELHQAFETKATQIEQLIAEISGLVGTAGAPGAVHWQGQVADAFRGEWESAYVKNLRQLVEALHGQARIVDDNRRRSNLALNGIDA